MRVFLDGIIFFLRFFSEMITITISGVCLYYSVKRIYYGNKSICNYMYLMIYVFFVFPIIINIIEPYVFRGFVEANVAMKDDSSLLIYYIFVITLLLVFFRIGKTSKVIDCQQLHVNPYVIWIATIIIVITFVYTVLKNGLGVLLFGFGGAYFSDEYEIFTPLFSLSIIFYLLITAYRKQISRIHYMVDSLIMILLLFIQGKRGMIAQCIIMYFFVMAITGQIKTKRVIKLLALSGVGIIIASYYYGVMLKGNASSILDFLCIDLSREYTLVYQFYCDKIGREISVNHFDAIVYILLFWVPRSIWPDKPYPFSNALTRSLVGLTTPSNVNMTWSTTCAIFSDLFDSFWYIGLVGGIVLIVFLCKKVDSSKMITAKVFLIYLIIHLLTVQLSSTLIALVVSKILLDLSEYVYTHSSEYNLKRKKHL